MSKEDILQFLQCRGTKFPAEFAWNFSVHLSVCIQMWMCTVSHAELKIRRYTESRTEKTDQKLMKPNTVRHICHEAHCCLSSGLDVTRTCLLECACHLFLKSLSGLTQDSLVRCKLESIWKRNHFSSDWALACHCCGTLTFPEVCLVLLGGGSQLICWAN